MPDSTSQYRRHPSYRIRLSSYVRVSELNIWPAVTVGILIFAATLGAGLLVRHLHGTEALRLVEAMMPTVRFFTSAVMTVAATTLALLLTLLSLSLNARSWLNVIHYRRLRQVALLVCVTFIIASMFMLLLLVSVPLEHSAALPGRWFGNFYRFVIGTMALLGGLVAGIVVMLFGALRDMIDVLALGRTDGRLVSVDRKP